jgi:small-conductance mechanosensitive channel
MRPSGAGSETQLTVAIVLVAIVFLVILAGGPSQLMRLVEQTLEAVVKSAADLYHGTSA